MGVRAGRVLGKEGVSVVVSVGVEVNKVGAAVRVGGGSSGS